MTTEPRQSSVAVQGVDLAYFEWGAAAGPVAGPVNSRPSLLFVHATGFHARCWDAVQRALGNDWHVIAVDMRGHGRTSKRPPYDWRQFGDDVVAFVEALDLAGVIGVGHSMGGHALIQAAARQPHRFAKLLLVDPVILDPASYAADEPSVPFATAEQHPVARRRNSWHSADEMFRHFAHRFPFSIWQPDVLLDYCRFGLLPQGDGFVLACPPLVEASIYMGSAGRDIAGAIAKVRQEVVVLRAHRKAERDGAMDFSQSPTWVGLADALPNGRDLYLPHLTHFIPMQQPDLVAEQIRAMTAPAQPAGPLATSSA